MRFALRAQFGLDAMRIQQFHGIRQPVAAARHCLNVDADCAQALHALPNSRTSLAQLPCQPLAGVQFAVRQQHQQRRVLYTARGRNSHSRRTRFSLPARMRAMLLRWVKMTNMATAAQKTQSGTSSGCSTMTVIANTTVDSMVARPT